jgi:hypothetical protein
MITVAIVAAIAIFGTLVLEIITITVLRIWGWFRSRGQIREQNKDAIAFTLADRIEKKQYTEVKGVFGKRTQHTQIVQGFYEESTGRLLDARAIASSQRPEQDVIDQHVSNGGLVIYT